MIRLTRRGRVVAVALTMFTAFTLGFATAEWCYWGQCDHLTGER